MLSLKTYSPLLAILGSIVFSGSVIAHTTVLTKNTPDGFETRDNLEGTTTVNHFSIAHGCDGKPVKAQSIVFPNGHDDIAVRTDTGEEVDLRDHIIGNAVMAPRPALDNRIFKKQRVAVGDVPEHDNRGLKTEDVRAFKYKQGHLPNEFIGLIPWRGTFPKFKEDSCATTLRVDIAIANYCTRSQCEDDDNRADIWIGRLTRKFDDPDVVSEGFWPFLNVVRDRENNPIPEECGDGFGLRVTPSDQSIDKFLPIRGYWPKDNFRKNPCGNNQTN